MSRSRRSYRFKQVLMLKLTRCLKDSRGSNVGINYPTVKESDIDGFARMWDHRGLKLIMDATSKRFAIDFANIVLRSYIDDLRAKAALALKAKQAATLVSGEIFHTPRELPASVPAPEPAKSTIVLTDMQ